MFDEDEDKEHLEHVRANLQKNRIELLLTVRRLRGGQRTPEQVRAVITRSKALVYRTILLRDALRRQFCVH